MLLSSRLPPATMPLSSTTIYDTSTEYSHPTNLTSIVSSVSLPKHYNVPFAIQHGYFRSVRYLLELHYDPNERDSQLRTPLILCAYIENDRWSSSLAQNLLEKGAKIALEDHARRNAMHHACAVQRFELVQLYLSCLDFNIEAQDCEGNTCLHYVAITGNCDIAELLMKSAERIGIRLDRYINREGCSAAVLALKYGHIECANQITHRDSDEFFVVPRPLSIYENPSTIVDNQGITTATKLHKKKKISSNPANHLSSTLPFGLLKIIFNDSDSSYSTRLASLCKQDRQSQHSKHQKQEAPQSSTTTTTTTINNVDRTKSTTVNGTRYCSTQVLVNDSHILSRTQNSQMNYNSNHNRQTSGRISSRLQLLNQRRFSNSKDQTTSFIQKTSSKTQLSIDDVSTIKSNSNISPIAHTENPNPSLMNVKLQRPKTTIHINPMPSPLNYDKIKRTRIQSASLKQKVLPNDRFDSSSTNTKQMHGTVATESIIYSQPHHNAHRPISSVTHRSASKSNDLSCPIREATGPTSRYNKPEELFGLRPEELFCSEQHQPKIFDQQSTTKTDESIRSKRSHLLKQQQQHAWQQDVDKLIDLYNIHHSTTYRKSAIPPLTVLQTAATTETVIDVPSGIKSRQSSVTKHSTTTTTSKSTNHSKHSTLASLNISRRNSVHRHSTKVTHA